MLEIVKREKEISRSRIKKIEAVAKFKRVVNKSAEVILQTYTTATTVEVIFMSILIQEKYHAVSNNLRRRQNIINRQKTSAKQI